MKISILSTNISFLLGLAGKKVRQRKQLALDVSHSTDFVVIWHILRMGNHSALFAIGNDNTDLCSLLRFMKYPAKCEWTSKIAENLYSDMFW